MGVDKFDYQVPQPKLLGLANSITSDGYVSLILDGKNTDVDYRVFDMRGRNITGSDHYPVGTYFLQAFNNNSILGTERFVNYSGQLNVDFREPSKQFLGRIAREGADSLLVFYEGEDMQVERFAQEVNVPESGSIDFPVELIRTLRTPHVEINNVPDNPTIDTAYLINLLASSPDYDGGEISLDLEQISGNAPFSFNGIDTLLVSPTTAGYNIFRFSATDARGLEQVADINFDVTSLTHLVKTLDFFGNLDGTYAGLEVWLRDKMAITDENGIATLEVRTTEGELTNLDSIEIYHPTNDTTFYAMRLPVNTEVDTQKVSTLTDPKGPSYWAGWSYNSILNRESSAAIFGMPNFQIRKFGNLENGVSDTIFIYCPDYTSPAGLEYKPVIQEIINQRNIDLDERAGEGRESKVHFYLLPNTEADSLFADNNGILLHFDGSSNHTTKEFESDASQDLFYILNADAFINEDISPTEPGIQGLTRLFNHEALQHGLGLIVHTPYNPNQGGGEDVQENMISGAIGSIKSQELDGMFFRLNYMPSHIRQFQNYETFHEENQ